MEQDVAKTEGEYKNFTGKRIKKMGKSWKSLEEPKLIRAAAKESVNNQNYSCWDIVCEYSDGQKFAPVEVDFNFPELAKQIADFMEPKMDESTFCDVDAAWKNETPVCRVIIHFAARCRDAVRAGDEVEAKRCAEIGGAVEDAVREYQSRRTTTEKQGSNKLSKPSKYI